MQTQYGERQFGSVKRYILTEGKAAGVHCIDVDAGDLAFTLLADRCLDIAGVKYRGKQFAFLSKNGVVSPHYYNPNGYGWLESFGGGLLVTCGLQNAGEPCTFGGMSHGLHGRIGNTPAEDVVTHVDQETGEITISGVARESVLMGCHYELCRNVTARIGGDCITVRDSIINLSEVPQPLMLLYHLNFGYPLLSPETELLIPGIRETISFDDISAKDLAEWIIFAPPIPGAPEKTYLHILDPVSDTGSFSLHNRANSPAPGVRVRYSTQSLPYLALWKNLRPGEYVAALEPCNNRLRGVAFEQEQGHLRWLEPGETEQTFVEFQFDVEG